MSAVRKLAAILVADIAGYSRLVGADEDGTLEQLRLIWSDVLDPGTSVHRGRVVKRTGDGAILEFSSVVEALHCAVDVQTAMVKRNSGVPAERRIEFRIGLHVGDVVEESDGDLMGDGVNIAARLEAICDVGGICLSEDAYRQVRDKAAATFADLGEQCFKNIARPVRAFRVVAAGATAETQGEPDGPKRTSSDRPSIAVLPFQNMSGDPEQEYFADGIVEDIITGLSRIKWLLVIARNSSFIYKGRAVDVREVGRELGVRYVLEGGVRRSGDRVRITAQLLEAESGSHLWAEKYDGALQDIFDLQDRITDRVVGIVEPSLTRSEIERSRRKRPESLDAYDFYLRALPHVAAQMPAEAKKALPLLEAALRLEPDYPAAHALLAWCHELCFARDGFDEAHRAAGLRHAQATMASSTDDATALAIAGFVTSLLSGEHEAALSAIDRALSLNASNATALYLGAQARALAGHTDAAPVLARRALSLSPFDPMAFQAHMALGECAIQEARYGEAAASFAHAAQASPGFSTAYLFQAISLALAGRESDAREPLRRGLELEPGFRSRQYAKLGLAEALRKKLAEGSLRLGLPE